MVRPSMKYPLCGTTFMSSESATIDRSYFPTILSKMGFNFKTKRLLFFGPPSLGCFGFTDTYTDQGFFQIQSLLSHVRHNDEIGQIMHILVENVQLVIGASRPPFTYDSGIFTSHDVLSMAIRVAT